MKDIIYISDIPWRDLTQRQHHLCNNLADYTNVMYFSCNSFLQLKKYLKINYREPFPLNPNLIYFELFLLPFTRIWQIKQINFFVSFIFLYFYLKFKRKKTKIILSHPSQVIFLKLPSEGFYYDYVDEAADFTSVIKNSAKLRKSEKKILDKSKGIFAPGIALQDQLKQAGFNNITLVPNGVNLNHFNTGLKYSKPDDLLTIKNPVIGFYGAINDLFDPDLIKYIATEIPGLNIVIIGPVSINTDILKGFPNILFLGTKLYEELPAYLSFINVWIVPFHQTEFTRKVNPVKVYEYLAAGKIVISTWLPELEPLNNYIYLTKTQEEFLERVKEAIRNPISPNSPEKTNQFLKSNSWQDGAGMIAEILQSE